MHENHKTAVSSVGDDAVISQLMAISPLDGRYASDLVDLAYLVGEGALIRYRLQVEASWLLYLMQHPCIKECTPSSKLGVMETLQQIAQGEVNHTSIVEVKRIEQQTRHDVKAVEYYLKRHLEMQGASANEVAFLHFACTSEDINNLSYAMMQRQLTQSLLLPEIERVLSILSEMTQKYADAAMISRTHGQTASPTTMGKELGVFLWRLYRQYTQLQQVPIMAKMAGATGNYNAHLVAYPDVDWPELAREFVENLGFVHNSWVTQIESHDALIEWCDVLSRFSMIGVDLCRDIWGYVSLGYFKQKFESQHTGSSTMPHKINPIDFENAEGNFGMAHSILAHFSQKLLISRYQRDLSDSTVLRSLGVAIGYLLLSMKNLQKGLKKLELGVERITEDIDQCWEVLAEAAQTLLRKYGDDQAYEKVKDTVRGRTVDRSMIFEIIRLSDIPDAEKERFFRLSPTLYIGCAQNLAVRASEVFVGSNTHH